jgi:hypothetical protein
MHIFQFGSLQITNDIQFLDNSFQNVTYKCQYIGEVKSFDNYAHLPLEVEEIIAKRNANDVYGGNTGVNRFISNLLVQ